MCHIISHQSLYKAVVERHSNSVNYELFIFENAQCITLLIRFVKLH
jgi:hypothetical protein